MTQSANKMVNNYMILGRDYYRYVIAFTYSRSGQQYLHLYLEDQGYHRLFQDITINNSPKREFYKSTKHCEVETTYA